LKERRSGKLKANFLGLQELRPPTSSRWASGKPTVNPEFFQHTSISQSDEIAFVLLGERSDYPFTKRSGDMGNSVREFGAIFRILFHNARFSSKWIPISLFTV